MYENELKELTEKMDKSISALQSEYASIRTGQAISGQSRHGRSKYLMIG